MYKKPCPYSYRHLVYKKGQEFLDIQYTTIIIIEALNYNHYVAGNCSYVSYNKKSKDLLFFHMYSFML